MLQGQRIVWETNPQISLNNVPPMNSPYLHNLHQVESDAVGAGGGGGGVYKDRYRWLAVLYVPQGVNQGRHHMLGRFDSEDEASAAYKWVGDIIATTLHVVTLCRVSLCLISGSCQNLTLFFYFIIHAGPRRSAYHRGVFF